MNSQHRSIWILITILALMVAGSKWINERGTCHRPTVKKSSIYKLERKNRRSCNWSKSQKDRSTPSVHDFVFVHEEPVPLNAQDLSQFAAKIADNEGEVKLRILVDKDGQYRAHKVIYADNEAVLNGIESVINQLVFTPAIRDHRPVEYWTNVQFYLR